MYIEFAKILGPVLAFLDFDDFDCRSGCLVGDVCALRANVHVEHTNNHKDEHLYGTDLSH